MAYLNLFIRERADLLAGKAEYDQDIAEADRWVQRALEAKRKQANAVRGGSMIPRLPHRRRHRVGLQGPPPWRGLRSGRSPKRPS